MVVSGKYLLKERVPGAPTAARQKESVFGGSTAEKIE